MQGGLSTVLRSTREPLFFMFESYFDILFMIG